jgi:uncharacterized membrane protein YvlD (DUF360 family)
MRALAGFVRRLLRVILLWFVDLLSLLGAAALTSGIVIEEANGAPALVVAAGAALVLGVANFLLRPLLLLLALPLGFLGTFVAGLIINPLLLLLTSRLLPGFEVTGFWDAFLASLLIALVNTIIIVLLNVDDENSVYQRRVEALALRRPYDVGPDPARGLVMLEIDGLSYWHIQKALARGYLPTLKEMMEVDGYRLSRIDCGLPSQTSACQAGILFGDNHDIPSFRWYDKEQHKLYVSSKDAPELNARYSHGQGLLRQGTSINNMLNGGAFNSLLTLADIRSDDPEVSRRRAEDIYLLVVNPYFLIRTVVVYLGDALVELVEGIVQRVRNVRPRLNRLHKAYPLLRAATTTFMRDVASYLGVLEIVRGTPAMYITWPGYDEVAHHSGPSTGDAFRILGRYDSAIARIRRTIATKAPRPYDLILLSDHGQSFGATFLQRYGYDLKTFIERQLPQGTQVTLTAGGDDGSISVNAVNRELQAIQQQEMGGRVGKAVVKQGERWSGQATQGTATVEATPANVTVCGSGNLGQVYFDLQPRKLTRAELDQAYPGMIEAVVRHEGVGFVVGYLPDGTPAVFGKRGQHNLHTGQITGEDPLIPYGDPALRGRQVRRIADYPHAGDLIVMSTVYPDGTVAAMEELIGSHGGLGGEQTDAFIFHPPDMDVPETENSADVFRILNARRDLPAAPPAPRATVDDWSWETLKSGTARVGRWLSLALRTLLLERDAFRRAVDDPYMTGPALLLGLLGSALAGYLMGPPHALLLPSRIATWLVSVLAVVVAGRVLRGRGGFTPTLRGLGFAQLSWLVEGIVAVTPVGPVARLLGTLYHFVAIWLGASEAQKLRGWRSFLLPVVAVLVMMVLSLSAKLIISGAAFTVSALAVELGLIAP